MEKEGFLNTKFFFNQVVGWNIQYNLNIYSKIQHMILKEISESNTSLTISDDYSQKMELKANIKNLNDYLDTLTCTQFLIQYSLLEETLFKRINLETSNVTSGGSLNRFKKYLPSEIISSHNWCILLDAEKIRNCLLHANGRIDISKNHSDLTKRIDYINKDECRCEIIDLWDQNTIDRIKNISPNKKPPQKLKLFENYLLYFIHACKEVVELK